MCEIKTLLTVSALLLAGTGFCIYGVNPKVEHHSEIMGESPCEKEYKKYYLNGGECYYLVDEDIGGCKCTWFLIHVKVLIQNMTRRKTFNSKPWFSQKVFH